MKKRDKGSVSVPDAGQERQAREATAEVLQTVPAEEAASAEQVVIETKESKKQSRVAKISFIWTIISMAYAIVSGATLIVNDWILAPYSYILLAMLCVYVVVFVAIVAAFFYRLTTSRLGDNLIGVRENEELAESLGIDTMKNKVFAFTVGGMLAGFAGSFYAHYILFISPVTFTITESINILVMVIFGGMSTMLGPILGAIALTVLPEFLRMAGALRLVIYGVALICFIIWLPQGVWGSLKNWHRNKQLSMESKE